MTTVTLMVMIK